MNLRSIRAQFGLTMALILAITVAGVSVLSVLTTRQAYLDLALRDTEFAADELVEMLNPIAKEIQDPGEFAVAAAPHVDDLTKQFFTDRGMTGYAIVVHRDGTMIYNPYVETGLNLARDLGEQGAHVMQLAYDTGFHGTIFYPWQDAGEERPRDKFAVMRPIPARPEWTVWVTAYTTDDLLLPFRTVQLHLIGVGIAALLLGIAVAVWQTGRLTRSLMVAKEELSKIAAGDLTADSPALERLVKRKDEMGDMARTLQQAKQQLRELIQSVHDGARRIHEASRSLTAASESTASAAQDASGGTTQLAQGASEQAARAAEISKTMAEFQQTTDQIASGAQESAGQVQEAAALLTQMVADLEEVTARAGAVAEKASGVAKKAIAGTEVVERSAAGMGRIRETVGEAARQLEELAGLSGQIGEITASISAIAEQTNMLALNAAIEAARAGEHGRGFAVVADEVRKLAEQASQSAGNIAELIRRIQEQTEAAVRAMATGNAEVDEGTRLARDTEAAFAEIRAEAEDNAALIQEIARGAQGVRASAGRVVEAFDAVAAITEENTAATEQMAAGIEQVTGSIQQIAGIAEENAAATEELSASVESLTAAADEVAGSARELADIADAMVARVDQFKL